MLYTEETVRMNIRNRDGKRVFYLGKSDTLTPGARDYLARERIRILDPQEVPLGEYRMENGAVLREKPEQMTHLNGDTLVYKTHPRIVFRGSMDTLEAELLLGQVKCSGFRKELGEILELARMLIRWEVMGEPVEAGRLCGLTQQELRRRSHFPQDYYGQAHFMPEWTDGEQILVLNIPNIRAFMHLDTVFTQVDRDKFILHPGILGSLRIFRLTPGSGSAPVRAEELRAPLDRVLAEALGLDRVTLIQCGGGDRIASDREQWNDGSNAFCISPGTVVVYDRNRITNAILREEGVRVLEMPSSELSRGRGGPRCMTMPLVRERI